MNRLNRMTGERVQKPILLYEPRGRRNRRRPWKIWNKSEHASLSVREFKDWKTFSLCLLSQSYTVISLRLSNIEKIIYLDFILMLFYYGGSFLFVLRKSLDSPVLYYVNFQSNQRNFILMNWQSM